jgi:hypothetical protein
VLDGVDTRFDRLTCSLIAVTMYGHFLAQPVLFIDQRRHFRRS